MAPQVSPDQRLRPSCAAADPFDTSKVNINSWCRQTYAPAGPRRRALLAALCRVQDCTQAKSTVGCDFVSADGYCLNRAGQQYCAESPEAASQSAGCLRASAVAAGARAVAQCTADEPSAADVALADGGDGDPWPKGAGLNYFCEKWYEPGTAAQVPSAPPPSRTNWTRLVPSSRTD